MLWAMHFPFASPVRKSQLWTRSILNSFQPIIFPCKGCEIVAFKMLKVFQCFELESFQTSPSQMVALLRNQTLLNQEMMQSILLLWDRFLGGDPFSLQGRFLDEQVFLIFLQDLKMTSLFLAANRLLCHFFSNNIYNISFTLLKS